MSGTISTTSAHIGERRARLSGAQCQRIGIARAPSHDPDVLILNKATSALGNFTEQAVVEAVHALGHRKILIFIAHRPSTVSECDTSFLLEEGELKGQCTPDELSGANKRFRAIAVGVER